ncbi:MAG: hypothetical protein A3J09_01480 [Candidatus Zambryskibacteria bacterium RIFCSPLOWO2_02_FULL_51_21]|uniref:Excinuclease ABC subunit C n=1 Tax=Candidatus Zambryskibacteria bacterium RIFCSPHIGHO2_02_FULL_43_37 TaxID=1802749 RepID=A0A1G2THI0_9BACT|nr:MAG: hypothetical protein A2723_01480 [Candidatus Zambryskibacteria bacterium RIFCSPHIGHO2_01_FULL_52_18]OHA96518.1 MAG: hypothetical protein A3D49_01420 [Candidatus Zambryskibacteria bacterium RIFCSPHIGHO2_02_FULL_43_37]OHB07187.1 MAG: hypothetical protein A2944_01185 [Candidatus Zambryskibacteria bacterium RIFCSPLOWO2_01_FULL_52_12]OHB11218.1 MAG: hypothetical protein A3J09_01480 [Candidatus Zambryskibacteria bacterium RIFCSPLOWO2_02_FULL_51_21]
MKSQELKKFNLPDAPGVYFFKKGKGILYIGKATSLADRVRSYFSKDIFLSRGPKIVKMLEEAESVEYAQTDSVLEALILEANEIKKHQPIYNSREKDDKSYNFVTVTREEFPKVVITRGSGTYGPFPHSGELKEALKIIRKIFPYRDDRCKLSGKPCFNAQIGLCPGPCAGKISKTDYRKQIRKIKLFFEGKKETLIKSLEREMKSYAKKHEFENAEIAKRQIFALQHIHDVVLIKQDLAPSTKSLTPSFRIEAYDIAHISGTNAVGVMTVVEDGEVNKSQYRKFKIREDKNDDTKNLREIISRRFGHPEWRFPNLVVVDGGKGQLNAARSELDKMGLEMIGVVSVVKDERHRARAILWQEARIKKQETKEKEILLANSEAHRFAINYHRLLRNKGFRI